MSGIRVWARCALCRFLLQKDEGIVIERGDGCRSSFWPKHETEVLVFVSEGGGTAIPDYATVYPGYHSACLDYCERIATVDFWGDHLNEEVTHISNVSKYHFSPSRLDDERRRDRIRKKWYVALPQLVPFCLDLPPEIWPMIATEDLVRLGATFELMDLWARRGSKSTTLKLYSSTTGTFNSVWASYIYMDGARYISNLSTSPPSNSSTFFIRVIDGSKVTDESALYVLEDHLGIRQLVHGGPDYDLTPLQETTHSIPDSCNNLWWRTLAAIKGSPSGHRLSVQSDGVKIRRIMLWTGDEGYGDEFKVTWPDRCRSSMWRLPMSLQALKASASSMLTVHFAPGISYTISKYTPEFLITSMVCNEPTTKGYAAIFCRKSNNLEAIWAVPETIPDGTLDKNNPLSMYAGYDGDITRHGCRMFLYFPMAPGERLVDVFIRASADQQSQMGLLFRTTRGRNFVLGPEQSPCHPTQSPSDPLTVRFWSAMYRHIYTFSQTEPHRIFFNQSPDVGIRLFLFDGPAGKRETIAYSPLSPLPQRPMGTYDLEIPARMCYDENLFSDSFPYTVSLGGVARITPSFKQHCDIPGQKLLCGILLEYKDDSPDIDTETGVHQDNPKLHNSWIALPPRLPTVLGEYRLDSLGTPIEVHSWNDALYFGWVLNSSSSGYLLDVTTRPQDNVALRSSDEYGWEMTWIRFPLEGFLEMWTDGTQSFFRWNTTGPDEMYPFAAFERPRHAIAALRA